MLLYVTWVAVYGLFGEQDSNIWTLMYYVLEPLFLAMFVYLLGGILHVLKGVINIVIGIQVLKIGYNVLFFLLPDLGSQVNGSKLFMSLVCAIIVICLIKARKT